MEKENQSSEPNCPTCGKPIPDGAPQGLCPGCLMDHAALTTQEGTVSEVPMQPPSIESMQVVFPHLEIDSLIGQGGMGFVYKARQPKLDRWVALKVMSPTLAQNPDFSKRFEREAKLLARLNHPNIVAVFDFGREGDFFYLLMEFIEGVNLRQAMQAEKFSSQKALSIVPEICEALQFAHDEGVLHRDIKPENILIDTKGRIKIADFGIAKMVDDGHDSFTKITGHGAAIGTPHYMAPEQVESPADVDHRADIYSLGVVFYELLTGELPLGRFDPPSSKSGAGVGVDEIVFQALAKERDKRQQQASEIKTQVETIGDKSSIKDETDQAVEKKPSFMHEPIGFGVLFVLGLMGACFILAFIIPDRTIFDDNQLKTIRWTFGVGNEPWLRLDQVFTGSRNREHYEFIPSAGSFSYGWGALLIWLVWSTLAYRRWGFALTFMPIGRGPKVARKERELRMPWVILIQHLNMALITFLLFALALYLNGDRAPLALIPFFVINQCMAVLIYCIEWKQAQKNATSRGKSYWHSLIQKFSPKKMALFILVFIFGPLIIGFSVMQFESSYNRKTVLEAQSAMVSEVHKRLDNLNTALKTARYEKRLIESELERAPDDPTIRVKLEHELAIREAMLEKVLELIPRATGAENIILQELKQLHENPPPPTQWWKFAMISFPLSISVLSFYGWRALKRIRKREVNSKFTYPAMLAALFLPFLVVDFMLGKLVYLPFDYPGWMYAGMALSLVTILAVDILLVKRVMAWVKGEVAMPGKS